MHHKQTKICQSMKQFCKNETVPAKLVVWTIDFKKMKMQWRGAMQCTMTAQTSAHKTCFTSHTSSSANTTQLSCTTIEFAEIRHFTANRNATLQNNTVPIARNKSQNTLRPCGTSKTATVQIANCTHSTTLLAPALHCNSHQELFCKHKM